MGDSKDGCIVDVDVVGLCKNGYSCILDVVSLCKNGYSCIFDIYTVTYMHNNHTHDRTCQIYIVA